jgi:L-threonylcarbamoyladenylate synthase
VPSTEVLVVDPVDPDPVAIARAAARIREGGLVAFPTETVYGLGAHALDAAAVARIFVAKERPANDPLIVHVARFEDVAPLVEQLPEQAHVLAARFWPGPLTLIMRRSRVVPDVVTAGLDTVAVRVPSHRVARALLEASGVPIAAPSANLFSRPSPTRAAHVLEDLDGRLDIVLDGGATTVGVESTVLDLSGPIPEVLRPGATSVEALREVIGDVRVRSAGSVAGQPDAMRSPGLLVKHYSPRATLTLYEGVDQAAVVARMRADARAAEAAGQRVGILDFGNDADPGVIAEQLYSRLRQFDAEGMHVILARGVAATDGLGLAVRDRLRRAAAGRLIKI